MLAALAKIAELNNGRPFSDGSNTQGLLREARLGAMYGDDLITHPTFRIGSPRLVHPEHAVDFVKEVIEEDSDAALR